MKRPKKYNEERSQREEDMHEIGDIIECKKNWM